jgi:hypothetical protein
VVLVPAEHVPQPPVEPVVALRRRPAAAAELAGWRFISGGLGSLRTLRMPLYLLFPQEAMTPSGLYPATAGVLYLARRW